MSEVFKLKLPKKAKPQKQITVKVAAQNLKAKRNNLFLKLLKIK